MLLQIEQERVANQDKEMDEVKLKSMVAAKIIRQLTEEQGNGNIRSAGNGRAVEGSTPKYSAKVSLCCMPASKIYHRAYTDRHTLPRFLPPGQSAKRTN